MWKGVEAIDWEQRLQPGTPREVTERLLVATSERLLVARRDGAMQSFPYDEMKNLTVRRLGLQGIISFFMPSSDEEQWVSFQFSTHRAIAHALVERMEQFR